MPFEIGLSDAGLVMPRTSEYLTEIRDRFVAETEIDVDWTNSEDPLVILTAIMAQLLDQQAEAVQAIYDAFNVASATGVQLSNIARLVGVNRESATKAVVTLTCEGDPGTAITIGKMAEGGGEDGRARWVSTEDVLIPAEGTIDVVFEAELAGRTVALAGEIDTIVTPVTGWDSVTNAAAASPGSDAETNPELRVRREQSIQLSAGIGLPATRAAVLDLEFIESCSVIDNPDNEDKIVEGISMLAHSWLVIVLPDTLTADQQTELLRVLYAKSPVSTRHSATDVVATITGDDGFQREVGFDYAEEIEADIVATLTMATGYSADDAGPALEALVDAHIATLQVGDDLFRLDLYALAADVPGITDVVFEINGVDANLVVTAIQRVVTGTWSAS